jgi:serine/threonine protein kinase
MTSCVVVMTTPNKTTHVDQHDPKGEMVKSPTFMKLEKFGYTKAGNGKEGKPHYEPHFTWKCLHVESGKAVEVEHWKEIENSEDILSVRRQSELLFESCSNLDNILTFCGSSIAISEQELCFPVTFEDGETLLRLVDDPLDESTVAEIMRDLLISLNHLHSHDLIYSHWVSTSYLFCFYAQHVFFQTEENVFVSREDGHCSLIWKSECFGDILRNEPPSHPGRKCAYISLLLT